MKVVLVNEGGIMTDVDNMVGTLAGGGHVLPAWMCNFNLTPSGGYNGFYVNLTNGGGGTPCYFLPWKNDAGVSMVLGGAADFFFTSTLSGCTVQVMGPANAPTVTHANARAVWTANSGSGDAAASNAAQATINTYLPTPGGGIGNASRVTKADYLGLARSPQGMAYARQTFKTAKKGMRITEFKAASDALGAEKVGAFVFGKKRKNGNWEFFYQATIAVIGKSMRDKSFFRKAIAEKFFYPEDAVLSPTQRFYP